MSIVSKIIELFFFILFLHDISICGMFGDSKEKAICTNENGLNGSTLTAIFRQFVTSFTIVTNRNMWGTIQ